MKYLSKISWVLLLAFLLVIFKAWFLSNFISAGDFSLTGVLLKEMHYFPIAWTNSGLGSNQTFLLFGYPLTFAWVLMGKFIGVFLAEKIVYYYLFILLSFISSFILSAKFVSNYFLRLFSSLIYTLNTYILMVVGGGQVGIALAYGITPLVLFCFINIINKVSFKKSLIAGLTLSIQLMFDIRIAYITLVVIGIFWLLKIIEVKKIQFIFKSFIFTYVIPGILALLLHAFWILPTLLNHQSPLAQLGSAYTSLGAVQYFSFAKLENTIALLHPNWSENIFGKVSFMRPEFLLLPIIAYTSLFFIYRLTSSKEKRYVLFFALIGIIGAFLAKGSNDPLGGIYLWMFDHVPGFVMFRDSTKFYLFVAISYSMLIPFTVAKVYEWLRDQQKLLISNFKFLIKLQNRIFNMQNIFLVLAIGYLLFLIRPALFGQLGGTFKPTTVPNEYTRLEKFLSTDNNFSRTLWLPSMQRFGFYSSIHPAVSASDLFSLTDLKKEEQKIAKSESLLQEAAIKYVIVPYDSQREIFLTDRKYDNSLYQKTVNQVGKIKFLKRIDGFGKIAVFEVPDAKNHFYISSQILDTSYKLSYKYISPVEYWVNLKNVKKGDRLVFSESYDTNWRANLVSSIKNNVLSINSSKFENRFNSFILPTDGDYSLRIYYTVQDYVNMGLIISMLFLIISLGALILLIFKKK